MNTREWLKAEKFPNDSLLIPTSDGFAEGYKLSEILERYAAHVIEEAIAKVGHAGDRYADPSRKNDLIRCGYEEASQVLRDMKEQQ